MASIRYSDMGLEALGARDFVVRKRTPTLPQIALIVFCAFLVSVCIIFAVDTIPGLVFMLLALFAIFGWFLIMQLMRSRDMLLVTEFQNALFAAALGLHNKFCMIIKRDGSIIYLDRSFQKLFPELLEQPKRTVDGLLRYGRASREDSDRVTGAIDKGTYEKVIFDITDTHGLVHRIVLSIEPIMRPAGFTMLRGREFVADRSAQAQASASTADGNGANLFSRSSVTLFSHVMESMKMGVYVSSPTGSFVYCNPLLEEWLGYDEGEIISRNLSITNLVPQRRNPNISNEPADIEGMVQLEKKVGGFQRAFLNQRIIRSESGQVMGCTAVVHLYNEEPTAENNKNVF